ncbi:MAG: ABC transporter permease, partial [Candidatus Bathyarchaeia archaeon]
MAVSAIGFSCIGQSLCILSGGFDLSVGSTVLVSGATAAFLIRNYNLNIWLAFLIIIILGLVIGLINGLLITLGKVNPLIATLAVSSILTGLVFFLTQGKFINVRDESFRFLGLYRLFNLKYLQMPIILLIILFIVFFFILKYSVYGKYIYSVGGNRIAAKFSGINVNLVIASVYIVSGILSAIGGYIFA